MTIGLMFFVLTNQQYIRDEISLYGYEPSQEVKSLAEQTSMTDSARRVFYVNHPSIEAKPSFVSACNANREHTIVLGCYHSKQAGIYILDVTDERLLGVKPVTAAHEMLHAEYDRLSYSERNRIDNLLQDYYQNQLKDDRIKQTIEAYRTTEPNDLINEMHSIFATEISNLPNELEAYYQRYFNNRQAVVALAESYQAEFVSRQAKVAEYDQQLKEWLPQIEAENAYLDAESKAIEQQRMQMENWKQNANTRAYNAAVPAYNARVNNYNARVVEQRKLVQKYNDLVEVRNNLQVEVDELIQAISSSNIPVTK